MEHMQADKRGFVYRDRPEGNVVEIAIRYQKDGKRGLYIHVTPVEIEHTAGCTLRTSKLSLGGNGDIQTYGFKVCALEVKKVSAKAMQTLAERIDRKMVEWTTMFREKGARAAGQAIYDMLGLDAVAA